MKNTFNDNSKPLPEIQGYHVHIYFERGAPSEKLAEELAKRIGAEAPDMIDEVIRYIRKVGPHTQPNLALHIKPEGFAAIVGAAQLDSKGLSILVHPVTDDDEKDHADRAMWIGQPVPLNLAFFRPSPPQAKGPEVK